MFASYWFIGFLLLFFAAYYLIPLEKRWIILLFGNLVFYFHAGWQGVVFILLTSLTVFLSALAINKKDTKKKKLFLYFGLFLNLCILAVIKYIGFAIRNINGILVLTGRMELEPISLFIPMGISFYTFQALGYLLDVYWERCEVQKNFFRFFLFISFFPQLIQGPISRYNDLSKTLFSPHPFSFEMFWGGIRRILWGYFKKLVIADRVGVALGAIRGDASYYDGAYVVIAMLMWSIQLYADFTGGIDITIGIAKSLGIDVTENFDAPYFSKNIAEFWRRWHITMGTWFRDYVFYPMSISRPLKKLTSVSKKRFGRKFARGVSVHVSTMVVWIATGIWHGAAWRYVAWGVLNGMVILASEDLKPFYARFHKKFPAVRKNVFYGAFEIIRTYVLMCCIRVFDLYASGRVCVKQFFSIFTDFDISRVTINNFLDMGLGKMDYLVILLGVIILVLSHPVMVYVRKDELRLNKVNNPYFSYLTCALITITILLLGNYGFGYDVSGFIYNRF